MEFQLGRDLIHDVIESDRNEKLKKFMIHQILWTVANSGEIGSANALIRHFHLYLYANGGFTCFDGEGERNIRPIVHPSEVVIEGDKKEVKNV